MDVEKIAVFVGVGFALAIGAFVLWGPSPRPRRKGQVIGITNLGYTCFLNALLQSLAACPIFLAWLKKQKEKNGPDCLAATLLSVLEKVNGFCTDFYGDVTPVEVISSLRNLWNFAPGHQDSHELLHTVLGALQSEAQTVQKRGCLSDALGESPSIICDFKGSGDPIGFRSVSCNDLSAENDPKVANGFDKNCNNRSQITSAANSISNVSISSNTKPGMILARSADIVARSSGDSGIENLENSKFCAISLPNIPTLSNEVHPFSGLLTSQLQCTNCKWKSSVRYDKLESVSLPLPPANIALTRRRYTLVELLSLLVMNEVIHDVECDGCATRCPAVKTLTLGKLPRCLCLHIPRTTWSNSGVPIKRDDPVIFPEILILDPFTFTETKKRSSRGNSILVTSQTTTEGKHRYQLRAVVEHRGPVDAGHFVCYRRGNRPNQWLYTSDTTVESTSLTDVLCASPYLLFYERINPSREQ